MQLTQSLAICSWLLYGFGVILTACRLVSRRIKLGGWKHLQIDDYLMIFALTNCTGVVVSINKVAENGSNYLPIGVAEGLSPDEKAMAVYGSIMTFVLEIFTITELWSVKACLIVLYSRLTKSVLPKQHLIVKLAAAYCGFTYVLVMALFLFFWCHPIHEYWEVPVRIAQCATYYHHMIFATTFNISSDIILFFIPIPIITKTKLPVKKKVILCCILCLGVFNILAAILNRYYNFTYPYSYVFLFWYMAEAGISIYVGNLPFCWPVFRIAFGIKETQNSGSFSYRQNKSPWRQKPRSRDILSTLGTSWDKSEEHDFAAEERLTGSDGASRIELILQGPQPGHHHKTSVSAGVGERMGDESPEPGAMPSADWGRSASAPTTRTGIRVVRTVDVTSSQ